MKILLLRHADADLNASSDFDRELTPYGLAQIQLVSASLQELDLQDFEVYVSPARRTSQTWDFVDQTLQVSLRVHSVEEIYSSETGAYWRIIKSVTSNNNVAFVGHNPAISSIASELSGEQIALETADWVLLDFDKVSLTGEVVARYEPQDNS